MTEPRALPYTWAEIRVGLQRNIWSLLDRLKLRDDRPHESQRGDIIYPLNPRRADRRPGSFLVWTAGDRAGAFVDFAVSDCKGSIIDLVMYIERLQSPMDAYWWALDFLNLDRQGAGGRPRTKAEDVQARERAEADRQAEVAKGRQRDEARSKALFALWLGLPEICGTIAETYLTGARAIPLGALKKQPGALRYAAEVDWIEPETGEVFTWRRAMVAAMTRGSDLAGLHVTFLKRDGSAKAALDKPKRMFGAVRGAAIRLSGGPSGLSPARAAKTGVRGPLAIGEGVETCLTVACARPDYRVWAAGSLANMGNQAWPDCASAVVLLRDNDLGDQARAAFEKAADHWRAMAQGRPVIVAASQVGSDFNDWGKAG